MRTTIGQMMKDRIYGFIFGAEGQGKTSLIMSLSKKSSGKDIAFITPESSGPTSVISLGYSPDIACEILDTRQDFTSDAVKAINAFAKDPAIRGICIDGTTVMCGKWIDLLSDGEGEKALGFEGWQEILSNFRKIESAAEKAVRAGKSVIYTAWEKEPTYESTMGGMDIKERGRPLIKGQGKTWLPGNCDILARLTSAHKKVLDPKTKKVTMKWVGQLQVHASDEWYAKTRWNLPNPCPADLNHVLELLQGQVKASQVPKKS